MRLTFPLSQEKTIVLENDNRNTIETLCQGAAMAKISLGQSALSFMHHQRFLVFLNSEKPTLFLCHPS